MSGALETISLIRNLLRPRGEAKLPLVSKTQFANLLQAYGLSGCSTQWVSRILQTGKIASNTDDLVQPIVWKITKLVEHFGNGLVPLSFEDSEHIKLLV